MTGEIVNLRRARKARARAEVAKAADANRVAHGVSKAARDIAKAREAVSVRRLDAHIRPRAEPDGGGDDGGEGGP